MNIDLLGIVNFDNKRLSPKLEKSTNIPFVNLSDEMFIKEQTNNFPYLKLIEIRNINGFDDDDDENGFDQDNLLDDDDDDFNNDDFNSMYDDDDIFTDTSLDDLEQIDEDDNYHD